MHFFMPMTPPTITAQEHKVAIINGAPVFYDPPRLKEARKALVSQLIKHKPERPFEGPVALNAIWLFPKGKSRKSGEWKTTRPDTDNLQKLLKDCMTICGFWRDDALVVKEQVEKRWSDDPGIYVEVDEL